MKTNKLLILGLITCGLVISSCGASKPTEDSKSEAPVSERNYHSYYNLARYYFLLNKNTKEKGIEYLNIASSHGVKKATNLLKKYKK